MNIRPLDNSGEIKDFSDFNKNLEPNAMTALANQIFQKQTFVENDGFNFEASFSLSIDVENTKKDVEKATEDFFGDEPLLDIEFNSADIKEEYVGAKEEQNLNQIAIANVVEQKGTQVEQEGVQVEQEGIQVEQEGVQVEQEGVQVEREGVQIEQEGVQVEQEGVQVEQKGIQVKQEGAQVEQESTSRRDAESQKTFKIIQNGVQQILKDRKIDCQNTPAFTKIIHEETFKRAATKDPQKEFNFTQQEVHQITDNILNRLQKEKLLFRLGADGQPILLSDKELEQLREGVKKYLVEEFNRQNLLAPTNEKPEEKSKKQVEETSNTDREALHFFTLNNIYNKIREAEVKQALNLSSINIHPSTSNTTEATIIEQIQKRAAENRKEEQDLKHQLDKDANIKQKDDTRFRKKQSELKDDKKLYDNKKDINKQKELNQSIMSEERKKQQVNILKKDKVKDSIDPEATPIDIIDTTKERRPA